MDAVWRIAIEKGAELLEGSRFMSAVPFPCERVEGLADEVESPLTGEFLIRCKSGGVVRPRSSRGVSQVGQSWVLSSIFAS